MSNILKIENKAQQEASVDIKQEVDKQIKGIKQLYQDKSGVGESATARLSVLNKTLLAKDKYEARILWAINALDSYLGKQWMKNSITMSMEDHVKIISPLVQEYQLAFNK